MRGKTENDLTLLTKAGEERYTGFELAATNIKQPLLLKMQVS